MNPVIVRKVKIGEGMPKICVPVVGVTRDEIFAQAENIAELSVDIVEWRGDWFEDITEQQQVREILSGLRKILKETPLLFTFRTLQEGGERELDVHSYELLKRFVIETGYADMIDVELFIETKKMAAVKDGVITNLIREAHAHGVKVVASNHDFMKTPSKDVIIKRLCVMQEAGADIAKIAVMPQNKEDVLTLLQATEEMCRIHGKTPVITMSMSGSGLISRLCGEVFGSAVTFGSAGQASAPGQMDAAELRNILNAIHRNLL